MSEEKRVIQGYEVTHSVYLGRGEVLFAVNHAEKLPYVVCDCSRGNPFGIEEYTNAVAGDDPVEMLRLFTDRLSARVTVIEAERTERGIPFETLTAADCLPESGEANLEGQIVAIRPERLSPEYRSIDHQLQLCTGGFGASPNSRGRAVYCTELYTGEKSQWSRSDIAGIIRPERLPEWAQEKLAALQKPGERDSVLDKIRQSKQEPAPGTPKKQRKNEPER